MILFVVVCVRVCPYFEWCQLFFVCSVSSSWALEDEEVVEVGMKKNFDCHSMENT